MENQIIVEIAGLMHDINMKAYSVACEMQRPCVIFKPRITLDGNMWCVILGENLQDGVCGFGKTPEKAFADFDREFCNGKIVLNKKAVE